MTKIHLCILFVSLSSIIAFFAPRTVIHQKWLIPLSNHIGDIDESPEVVAYNTYVVPKTCRDHIHSSRPCNHLLNDSLRT